MIDMHSKYGNIHKNKMFYGLIYINNHIIVRVNYTLLDIKLSIKNNTILSDLFDKYD